MHTTKTKNAAFIHNGDYYGEIHIVGKNRDNEDSEVIVKMSDLKEFLWGTLREELASVVEDAKPEKLLEMALLLKVKFPGKD